MIPVWFLLVGMLGGCSLTNRNAPPTYWSANQALDQVPGGVTQILHEEALGQDRLIIFRTSQQNDPQVCLVLGEFGKWHADSVAYSPLKKIGPLAVARQNFGRVLEGSVVRAKAHVIYGEVSDPNIEWVEVTLTNETKRAKVENSVWIVAFGMEDFSRDLKPYSIRAGHGSQTMFQQDSSH